MLKALQNNFLLNKFYFSKPELERLLLLSSLFGIGLTAIRILYTGQWMFAWLTWNLFLAAIPYFITRFAIKQIGWIESHIKFALLFTAWLLFIPNSFYIITDLFHLEKTPVIPMWFDLALILSFAWNGILFGILSVRQMEKIMMAKFPAMREWEFVYPIMLLNAFGVYIGRYLRYNTWDVITAPFQLTSDLIYLLFHPIRNRFDWSMILCYTVFISLMYLVVKRVGKALR